LNSKKIKIESGSRWRETLNTIGLGTLLVMLVPSFYKLHKNAHISYTAGAKIEWLQPTTLNQATFAPVSNDRWRFSFTKIERLLWNSKLSESGAVSINSDTLTLLEQTTRLLPKAFTTEESKRLTFLIEKSIPEKHGQQLSKLLKQYQLYQQDYQANLNQITQANGEELLALLETSEHQLQSRQQRYFGNKTAEDLFHKKNITTRYLNKRRIVNLTTGLTKEEKRDRLDSLNEVYRKTLKTNSSK